MYLSILRLWNFRKYAGADNKPGLEIHFQKGVNVLIGENDSGKTAIVDAIRYVLRTQSGEFIQFEDKDFYQDSDGNRKDEFKIKSSDVPWSGTECRFSFSGIFWKERMSINKQYGHLRILYGMPSCCLYPPTPKVVVTSSTRYTPFLEGLR